MPTAHSPKPKAAQLEAERVLNDPDATIEALQSAARMVTRGTLITYRESDPKSCRDAIHEALKNPIDHSRAARRARRTARQAVQPKAHSPKPDPAPPKAQSPKPTA